MKKNVYQKTQLVFFLLLLLCISKTHAQSHLVEGYMVTTSKDTIRGFIYDDNNWKVKAIQFTEAKTEEPKAYPISSFLSIFLKPYNEYYFTKTVDMDKKPIRAEQLESLPARKMVNETVLLKLLAGGKINLYSYLDENNKRHFFAEKDAKMEELGYVKYISNAKYFVELPFYIETLKSLTADCDKVKINKPKFTEASIKTIVEKYNSCFGNAQSFVLAKEKAKLSGGIIAGARSTSFDYVGPDHTVNKAYSFPGADEGVYNTTTTAVGGIYLDLIPKRESKQLSGGMQLLYQQTGTFSAVLDKPNIYHREYNAKFSYLSAGVNFKRYLLKTRRPAIYIKAGIGYNCLMSQSATAYVNDVIIGTPKHVDFMEFSSSGFNYNAALGLNLKRLFVEVQYQHDNIYSNPGSTASLTGIGLLVGYKVF